MRPIRIELVAVMAAATFFSGCARPGSPDAPPPAARRDETPAWWTAALAEMKATNRPGIAIVLPAGAAEREALRVVLDQLLKRDDFLPQETEFQVRWLEAVYVLVPGERVGARAGETLVRIDADGKRMAGTTTPLDAARFLEATRGLLRDAEGLALFPKIPPSSDVAKALADVRAADDEGAAAAIQRAAEAFPAATTAVVDAWESEKDATAQLRLAAVIRAAFVLRRGDDKTAAERPLPFGAQWKRSDAPEPDPCVACGMARMSPRRLDVLELLAKDA